MSELHHLAKNTAIQLAGRVVGTFLGVFTIAVMTRALSADGYGQFTVAFTFLAIAGALADFGFTLTTTQMISERPDDESKIVSTAFTIRLASGIFFFACAILLALVMPYDAVVKLAITIGALSFFGMTVSQMLMGVFQKHMAMWRPALAEAISRALILLIIIILAKTQATVPHMMWAFVAGNMFLFLMNFLSANRYAQIRLTIDSNLLNIFFHRSWPLALSILFNLLYLKGDVIFMSLLGRSDAEIGHYGAAYKVLDVISVIPTMFMGLLLPLMTRAWAERNRETFHTHLQRAFDLFSLLAFPIMAGTIVLATPVMTLVAGADFIASGKYLVILMLANTAVFFGILFSHAIVALNKQKTILPAFFLTAVVTTVLYLVTIPIFGAVGAAWSTVASEVMIGTIAMIVVLRVSGFRPRFRSALASFVSAILMGAVLYFVHATLKESGLAILIEVVLGAFVFFAFAFLFGSVKKETIRLLLKPTV